MDAFVLAGGQGKRLGIVTQSRQKATLSFEGNPLISHIIRGLLQERSIGKIFVLTGYRGHDVHEVLDSCYSHQCQSGKITILDFPNIHGTLSRLTAALDEVKPSTGCYVCGIDSLLHKQVLSRFIAFISKHSSDVVLSFSPRLEIATTHKIGCLQGDQLISYTTTDENNQIHDPERCRLCTDVGIRYFPLWFLRKLLRIKCKNNIFIPSEIKELILSETIVRGFLFKENWKHFAVIEDFYGSLTSN